MAEECKLEGNKAAAEKNWSLAERCYSDGITKLQHSQKELEVQLYSNRSLARVYLGKLQDACNDAEKVIGLDSKFEKGYLRLASALEAMNLKCTSMDDLETCPVMACYRAGLIAIPNSKIIKDAVKLSFPWLTDEKRSSAKTSDNIMLGKGKTQKKVSIPSKHERNSCVSVDIRGATGPHELRINGVYVLTEEISCGWPIYKKQIDEETEDGDVDEDDNLILEYNSGLSEWMIKHSSFKGTHRSFVFVKCTSMCRPEGCTATWQSLEEKKTILYPALSVVSADQRCRDDKDHFLKYKHTCTAVEIRGAAGRKSGGINGIYEPTETPSGGWPLFRKLPIASAPQIDGKVGGTVATVPTAPLSSSSNTSSTGAGGIGGGGLLGSSSDHIVWLEYNPYFKSWQVKPTACLGTNRSWAYVVCKEFVGVRPEQCR